MAFLVISGNSMLFSLQEAWMSMGFEFGNSTEYTNDGNTYIGAPGFNLNGYIFGDKKDIGIFFHYSFLFPVIVNGNGKLKEYDDLQWEFIVGPGFRYSFTDKLKLQFGIGIDWSPILAYYTENSADYSKSAINLGVGADVGIKYDITDFFYINGGITLSYMFTSYTSITSNQKISNDVSTVTRVFSGRVKGYSMFGIKPYICIGFNYYQEKAVWGKPQK
jgi:hypothetical protein